jgi:hypothetical protein
MGGDGTMSDFVSYSIRIGEYSVHGDLRKEDIQKPADEVFSRVLRPALCALLSQFPNAYPQLLMDEFMERFKEGVRTERL